MCKLNDEKISTERDPYEPVIPPCDDQGSREVEERRRLKSLTQLKEVLETYDGRAVIWQILCDTGLYRSSFSNDALSMAFNEGQRNIGLLLIDRIMLVSPEAYKLMQEEANERRKRSAGSGTRAEPGRG